MLGLMYDHPYVFTPTIAKIMLPVWVCLLVSTVRAIRRDMEKEKAGDLSKEETDERMGINALVLFFSFAFTVGCLFRRRHTPRHPTPDIRAFPGPVRYGIRKSRSKTSGGTGFPNKNPCMKSSPIDRTRSNSSSRSTPSRQTLMFTS